MFAGPHRGRPSPRHLTRAPHPAPVPAAEAEVAPRVRVQRSRLAFAVAVTLAALPVVVLDNLSATAEPNGSRVELATIAAAARSSSKPSTTVSTVRRTTTSAAPAATVAPTTEAPATTAAPVAPVIRVQAPATTAPPTTAPPTTAPPNVGAHPNDAATWDRLAQCESSGNWNLNTGNGYYGGLQFSLATWQNVGGTGYPHQATRAEQIYRGQVLQARAGWGQWPYCARRLGYL